MALIIVLQLMALVMVTAVAFLIASDTNSNFVRSEKRSMQALYNAEAGTKLVLKDLYDKVASANVSNPSSIYATVAEYDNRTFSGSISGPDGSSAGTYNVQVTVDPSSYGSDGTLYNYKQVTFQASGTADGINRRLNAVVKVGLKFPMAFEYASFINNYWYCANLYAHFNINGNIAANGNCDLKDADQVVDLNGNPIYDADGNAISVGGRRAAGTFGGYTSQWHGYDHAEPKAPLLNMPPLGDVDYYVTQAKAGNGYVSRGATTLISKVFGETGVQNILLDGSSTPLNISGMVVVKGDCIIRGSISGQGTLYVGGNLYIASDLKYTSDYSTRPLYDPAHDSAESFYSGPRNGGATSLAQWISNNSSRPCVAYCVAGNVVLGDVSNAGWWSGFSATTPGGWSGNVPGVSRIVNGYYPGTTKTYCDMHEDAGSDKIWGSNDSDEDDLSWSVQLDGGSGLTSLTKLKVTGGSVTVPSGYQVIAGTGEDVDGDGAYTPAYGWQKFLFHDNYGNALTNPSYLTCKNWPGTTTYSSFLQASNISLTQMKNPIHIDGFLFCNHLIAGYLGKDYYSTVLHGGYAARQLAFLLWTTTDSYSFTIEHDDRIHSLLGPMLPLTPGIEPAQWQDGG
jgi:hypothetical protein